MTGNKSLYPKKYIPKNLSKKERKKQKQELEKSRKAYKKGKYYTRKKMKTYKKRSSPHIRKAKKIYKIDSIKPSKELANKTGCTLNALKQIVDKGEGAYYSSGSRPNQTAQSWGYARLASAITGGKSAAVDFHIIKDGCKKTKKAYKLALQSRKKHGKGTRRVPKRKV